MQEYIAKQGDTIQSIAVQHKLHWETVWQHSSNSTLRKKRKEPNLLFPGDKVCIDNNFGPKTAAALRKFQRDHDLKATGKADEATLKKLGDVHVY